MPTYGFRIVSTDFKNCESVIDVSGCTTPEIAKAVCLEIAISSGWTPPRWWQFWRYGDTKVE